MRPFLLMAQVNPRGYSVLLQRKITDFGADCAFGKVNEKLKEHYGIHVSENGIRVKILHHAKQLKQLQNEQLGKIESIAKMCVISETDGSMVPIVKTRDVELGKRIDKRKGKSLL